MNYTDIEVKEILTGHQVSRDEAEKLIKQSIEDINTVVKYERCSNHIEVHTSRQHALWIEELAGKSLMNGEGIGGHIIDSQPFFVCESAHLAADFGDGAQPYSVDNLITMYQLYN